MCTEKQPGLLAGRDKLIEQRIKQQRKRQERFIQKNNKTNGSQATLETVSISDDDGEEEEEEWKPRDRTSPIRKLPGELSNTFDRLQLSYRQRAMAAAHTLSIAGQDISKTAVSKSSLHRHAKRTRIEKAQAIKASFDISSYPIVHFDTKLVMPKGKYLEVRGSVLISGGDELQEPKLLGIPKFPSSKGADVAATVAQ